MGYGKIVFSTEPEARKVLDEIMKRTGTAPKKKTVKKKKKVKK